MKTLEATFESSTRVYTYITALEVKPGQRFLTKTPAKGWTYVTVHKAHQSDQRDPGAKFEYKELRTELKTQLHDDVWHATADDHLDVTTGKGTTEALAIMDLLLQLNHL
jgi:hypothetical protein